MNSAKFMLEGVSKVMVMSQFLGTRTQVVLSSDRRNNIEIR